MNPFTFRLMKFAFLTAVLALNACPARAAAQAAAQGTMPSQHAPAERSTILTLTVNGVSKQIALGDLASMPQSTLRVHNAHANKDEVYRGVAVSDLLRAAGLPFSKETQQTLLRSYLRAQGTDFYFVLFSASEVEPDLNASSVIVATGVDGHDLGADGAFKLVSSGDKRPARWVRNLVSLTLLTVN